MSKTSVNLRGIGIIEVMVTLAILGLLASAAWPNMADMLARHRVTVAASELRSDLALARSEASIRNISTIVTFGSSDSMSCYTIYSRNGEVGRCTCTAQPGSACIGSFVEVKTVQRLARDGVLITTLNEWSKVGPRLQFSPPRMTPDPVDFRALVKSNRVGQLQVSMNAIGRISTCTPDGSMPGVISC